MTHLLSSGLFFSPSVPRSCLNASFFPVHFSLWSPILFSLLQAGFRPVQPPLDQNSLFISDRFNKASQALKQLLPLSISMKSLILVCNPAYFHKLISTDHPSLFCSMELKFFLAGALASISLQLMQLFVNLLFVKNWQSFRVLHAALVVIGPIDTFHLSLP